MAGRRLEVLLVGKDAGGTAVLDKLAAKSKQTEQQTTSLGKATTAAMIAGGAALVKFGKTAVEEYQRIGMETIKLQRYMGGTPEQMSRMRFALQQTGTDVDAFAKSMGRASKTLFDAKDPMGRFGIETRDASDEMRPMSDVLLDVADKMNAMPAGAERTAYAMSIFGKSGADMIPFLSRGSEGIEELMSKTDEYGLVLSGANLQAVKDNKAAQRELTAAMDGLQVKIGAGVLPVLTKMTSTMASIPGPVADVIGPVAGLTGAMIGLVAVYQKIGGILGPVNSKLNSGQSGVRGMTSGMAGLAGAVTLASAGFVIASDAMAKMNAETDALVGKVKGTTDAVTSYEQLNSVIAQTRTEAEGLHAAAADMKNPFDADLIIQYNQTGDALFRQAEAQEALRKEVDEYARANGVSNDVALIEVQTKKKGEQAAKDKAAADAEATAGMSEQEKQQYELNSATEEAIKLVKEQNDQLRAQLDPLFAAEKAWRDQENAQRSSIEANTELGVAQAAYNDAVAIFGANSPQAVEAFNALTLATTAKKDADLAAVQSAGDLEFKTELLKTSIATGTVTLEGARAKLDEWVAAGLITADQAAVTAARLTDVANAGYAIDGALRGAAEASRIAYDRLRELGTLGVGIGDADIGDNFARGLRGNARGANNVKDGWFTVGEEGPELALKNGSKLSIFSNPQSTAMRNSSHPTLESDRAGDSYGGDKWVTYEDGSTGLQRRDANGNYRGITYAEDPGAYDLKAGMDFAALGWPEEDVKALAELINGGGTGGSGFAQASGVTVVVNNAGSVITESDLVQTIRSGLMQAGRYGQASL